MLEVKLGKFIKIRKRNGQIISSIVTHAYKEFIYLEGYGKLYPEDILEVLD